MRVTKLLKFSELSTSAFNVFSAFISDQLIVGRYLPQGSILQHPNIKLFVTHCGANSIQDTVHAAKPVLTYPGFGDQPLLSNQLVSKKLGKLLKTFSYEAMEPLLDELLSEPNHSQMVERLEAIKREQINYGGFVRGVQVIEDVIEGRLVVNRSVDSSDVMGYPIGQAVLISSLVAMALILLILGILYYLFGLISSIIYAKKKKLLSKTD